MAALPKEVQALWASYEAGELNAAVNDAKAELAKAKEPATKIQVLEVTVWAQLAQEDTDAAKSSAEEAIKIAKDSKDTALEVKAMCLLAQAEAAKGDMSAATAQTTKALSMAKDVATKIDVQKAVRDLYMSTGKIPEAKEAAVKAVTLAREAGDAVKEGAACLLVAETAMSAKSSKEAVSAAKDALQLYKEAGNVAGQGSALMTIVMADMEDEKGVSLQAAQERAALFKKQDDKAEEASSMLALASAYLARLAKKLSYCAVASAEDSLGALQAAKDAYNLFKEVNDMAGMDAAMNESVRTLVFNQVPESLMATGSNPEQILTDVLSGTFTTPFNALPPKPTTVSKTAKIEDIVPTAKQLEKGKFQWTKPLDGWTYTLIWQPAKDREAKRKPRGSYEILTTATGNVSQVANVDYAVKSNDANDRNKAMAVFMVSPDIYWDYSAGFMALVNAIAAMATSNLKFLSVVHLTESATDMSTVYDTRVRPFYHYNATVGIIRSCRIECPTIEVGLVGGDCASWLSDPLPMVESIFDTVESDESEFMYKRGEYFAPLLVHRPPDEEVTYVKAFKGYSK